jgi:hypothetical protein
MRYVKICSECGSSSKSVLEYCPECGSQKQVRFDEISLYSSFVKYLSSKISFIDNSERIVGLLLNLIILTIGIIIINPLIESSEFLWIFFFLFAAQGVIKEISFRINALSKLYILSRIIIFTFIGCGVGNLISYTGKIHGFILYQFFTPVMIIEEIANGNMLTILGGIFGVVFLVISRFITRLAIE